MGRLPKLFMPEELRALVEAAFNKHIKEHEAIRERLLKGETYSDV